MAQAMGIPVPWVYTGVFAIGAAMAAASGVLFAGVLLSMHFLNSWISTVLKLGDLSPERFSLTNSVFHWSGTIATIFTALLLGRMGLRWVLVLLAIGFGSLLTIATLGFSSATVLTLAVCLAGFGIIGCQGALNASSGLIYPVSCRPTGVGAALGVGRIGSLSGPLVGGYFLAQHRLRGHGDPQLLAAAL